MSSRSPLPLLLSGLLLTGFIGSCQLVPRSDEAETTSSEPSESSTEDIFRDAEGGGSGNFEDRGRDLQDRAEEIRTMEGSDQEPTDAALEWEKERQKLNEEAGVR